MVENPDLIYSDSHPLLQEELLKIFFRDGPEFEIQGLLLLPILYLKNSER
jgi:hypothetical protein